MRILRNIALVLCGFILLLVIGIFIFLKTFDAKKYLPSITHQISQSIKREVTIEDAKLDFSFTNFSLDLLNLSIADDSAFSKTPFVIIKKISASIDLSTLIFKKEIRITHIDVFSPAISIIKSPVGQINIQSMVAQPTDTASSSTEGAAQKTSAGVPSAALPVLTVKSINVHDALVSYSDQNPQMPLNLSFSDIQVKVSDFSLTAPFNFNIDLNAWGKNENINILGKCNLNISKASALITELKIQSDLNNLDLKKVRSITPTLATVPVWPTDLKGNLIVQVPSFNASSEVLEGKGDLNVSNIQIIGVNILKLLLDQLNFIPGLSDQISANLSESLKSKLDNDTTVIDSVLAKFDLRNKIITISDGEIVSKLFLIQTQGTVGLDMNTAMEVKAYLSTDVSSELVKSTKYFGSLLDDQNRIFIPGNVLGKLPEIHYKPEVDYLTKKIAVSEGADQLQKVLDKNPQVKNILNQVFGSGTTGQDAVGTGTEAPSDTPQKDESAKKIINNVLNGIFK